MCIHTHTHTHTYTGQWQAVSSSGLWPCLLSPRVHFSLYWHPWRWAVWFMVGQWAHGAGASSCRRAGQHWSSHGAGHGEGQHAHTHTHRLFQSRFKKMYIQAHYEITVLIPPPPHNVMHMHHHHTHTRAPPKHTRSSPGRYVTLSSLPTAPPMLGGQRTPTLYPPGWRVPWMHWSGYHSSQLTPALHKTILECTQWRLGQLLKDHQLFKFCSLLNLLCLR